MRPRILDLFCKAGGAGKGYADAGFEVVGVDIKSQPRYPFEFIQQDAMRVLTGKRDHPEGCGMVDPEVMEAWYAEWWQLDLARFDAVHASPPCQFRAAYNRRPGHVAESPNLIPEVRRLLEVTGLPYVIENVEGARDQLRDPVRLCGSSFGLDVRRHRLFESNVPLLAPPCDHSWQTPRFPPATNRTNLRRTVEVGVWRIPVAVQQRAMGIDWMNRRELSEAIPPAYTQFLGEQLMTFLNRERAVA